MLITSLDDRDARVVTMNVAGPGALLVAKLHKIAERTSNEDRVKDKDSLDVLRLLRAIPTEGLVARLTRMKDRTDAGREPALRGPTLSTIITPSPNASAA